MRILTIDSEHLRKRLPPQQGERDAPWIPLANLATGTIIGARHLYEGCSDLKDWPFVTLYVPGPMGEEEHEVELVPGGFIWRGDEDEAPHRYLHLDIRTGEVWLERHNNTAGTNRRAMAVPRPDFALTVPEAEDVRVALEVTFQIRRRRREMRRLGPFLPSSGRGHGMAYGGKAYPDIIGIGEGELPKC